MDQQPGQKTAPRLALPRWEFISLCAALMALNAVAIDIMLPGLQAIGADLGITDENHRQFVVSAYFGGMAAALLIYGPASDRFGRRAPLFIGLTIYTLAAFAAVFAPTFGWLLAIRFIQGVGAASVRVIIVSIVRDLFGGRQMAEIMSLAFMVLMVIPVIAPSIGQLVMLFGNWHLIFLCMGVVSLGFSIWAAFRLPETLHPEDRRPFSLKAVVQAFGTVLSTRVSLCYALGTTFVFGALFGFINSAQQIYVEVYGLGLWFPLIFAAVASMMALSSYLNSRFVGRFGMRKLSHGALLAYIVFGTIWFVWSLFGQLPLPAFLVLFGTLMFLFSWIGPNFNTIAMEPLGHIAGSAASVQSFLQTLGGGIIGVLIGQAFDGTTVPLAFGFFAVGLIALGLVLFAERGKLFQAHHHRLR